ncbi:MAG TPA: hypothetical protein VGN16_21105 [Acidobacteriaceae bacterium]|jgi:hypothetical protein
MAVAFFPWTSLPAFDHGCLGKEQHESEAAAIATQGFRVRQGVARSGDGAHPYECEFCGKWHIGH